VGETAQLIFASPFQNPSALVVWGNGAGRQYQLHHSISEPGSVITIDVALGDECEFGCRALVLLTAPNQLADSVLPVPVPLSPLLDVTLPQSVSTTVTIDVPDTNRAFPDGAIAVAIGLAGDLTIDGGVMVPAEVMEPGANAKIVVTAEPGSQATVFVVDKAMLDVGAPLNAHPVAELDKLFTLSKGDDFDSHDTRLKLYSSSGYHAFADSEIERAAADPWAYETNWPLSPGSYNADTVGQTPSEYLADKVGQLTLFPPAYADYTDWGDAYSTRGGASLPSLSGGMVAESAAVMDSDDGADKTPEVQKGAIAATAAGTNSGRPGPAMYTRSDFATTPFFEAGAVVGADGTVSLPFTLPDNIGTFEVRVYVVGGSDPITGSDHDHTHKFGSAVTTFIQRRAVSMVASLPRVVRPGDTFECGVSLTGHGTDGEILPAAGLQIHAQVAADTTALSLRGDNTDAVTLDGGAGGGPHEIIFPFTVPPASQGGGIGSATLTFSASINDASGLVMDALELPLAVRAPQSTVLVATSLAITASSDAAAPLWPEGLDLPLAMPGSGQIDITAGVGNLPSVFANTGDVVARNLNNGQTLVAALFPATALSLYYSPGAPLPPMIPLDLAKLEAKLDAAAVAFTKAVGTLQKYTSSTLGLMWRPEDTEYHWQRPDVYLNSFGLMALQIASELIPTPVVDPIPTPAPTTGPVVPQGPVVNQEAPVVTWSSLDFSIDAIPASTWRSALQTELNAQVKRARNRPYGNACTANCYQSYSTIARVRAALGHSVEFDEAATQEELSMDRLFTPENLVAHSDDVSYLAYIALAYTLHPSAAVPDLAAQIETRLNGVYQRLANLIRVQGRTAYISSSSGSDHSAGLEANALVLLAIARASSAARDQYFSDTSGSSLAAKIASYVADGGGDGRSACFGGGYWMGPRSAAIAAVSLAAYDLAHGSTNPDLVFAATGGGVDMLNFEASAASEPPRSSSTQWSELEVHGSEPPAPLCFSVTGTGQVSVLAALSFVPASPPIEGALYRGLYVEKVIRAMDIGTGKAVGPPLQILSLGMSVVVTIQVTSSDDLSRVSLEDLSAGGLEPVDPKVSGDTAGSTTSNGCDGFANFWWSWWCVPAFYYRETMADRVLWASGGRFSAGTHSVSYQAIAATRGTFTVPPAFAYVDDQPEILGLSQASRIVIADGPTVSPLRRLQSACQAPCVIGLQQGSPATPLPAPNDAVAVAAFLDARGVTVTTGTVPQACAGGCPNGGVCQLSTGTCACYDGVTYLDGDCPTQSTGIVEYNMPTSAAPTATPTAAPTAAPTNAPTKAPRKPTADVALEAVDAGTTIGSYSYVVLGAVLSLLVLQM